MLRTHQAGGDRPHRHDPHPGARQGPGGGQGRPQARQPVRGPARADDPRRAPVLPGPRARRRHPGRDDRREPARCGSTTAASPTRSRCSRRSTRSPRSASRNPALYRMLVGALRTLAGEPSPLVSAAFFWKLLSLEGFHPLLDACARCGDEDGPFPAFDLGDGGVLCAHVRPATAGAGSTRRRSRCSGGSSAATCGGRSPSRRARPPSEVERLGVAAARAPPRAPPAQRPPARARLNADVDR